VCARRSEEGGSGQHDGDNQRGGAYHDPADVRGASERFQDSGDQPEYPLQKALTDALPERLIVAGMSEDGRDSVADGGVVECDVRSRACLLL